MKGAEIHCTCHINKTLIQYTHTDTKYTENRSTQRGHYSTKDKPSFQSVGLIRENMFLHLDVSLHLNIHSHQHHADWLTVVLIYGGRLNPVWEY